MCWPELQKKEMVWRASLLELAVLPLRVRGCCSLGGSSTSKATSGPSSVIPASYPTSNQPKERWIVPSSPLQPTLTDGLSMLTTRHQATPWGASMPGPRLCRLTRAGCAYSQIGPHSVFTFAITQHGKWLSGWNMGVKIKSCFHENEAECFRNSTRASHQNKLSVQSDGTWQL